MRERIEAATRFGFDGISLPGRELNGWRNEALKIRGERLLPFMELSLGNTGTLLADDEAGRRDCVESLSELFRLCAELGVRRFNLPPCLLQDHPSMCRGRTRAELDRRLISALPPVLEAAERHGVTLLLEPVNRYESDYLNSLSHAAELCAAVNHSALRFTADFFHLQLEELNVARALQETLSWLGHVHVAENTRVEPGPGLLDFKPGFAVLKDAGYSGWVTVECRALSGPADEVLPASVTYLKRCWTDA